MSDVESLAYVQTAIAKYRGVISSRTYSAIAERINHARGELDSLKSFNGHLSAEADILRSKNEALEAEIAGLRSELAAKSVVASDEVIAEKIEKIAEESASASPAQNNVEVVAAIESDALAE